MGAPEKPPSAGLDRQPSCGEAVVADPVRAEARPAVHRLAEVIRSLALRHRDRLAELKTQSTLFEEDDFVWWSIVRSFSTMGSSRGAAGVHERRDQLTFDTVAAHPPSARRRRIEGVLRAAKVRMPTQKAKWLLENHGRIAEMGGPVAARRALAACADRGEMILWWRQFSGIGPKYARNIMMDVHHPAFRDSIAVDARLKKVLHALGLELRPFPEGEDFFRDAARAAEVEPWDLDRLVYNFESEVLQVLKRSPCEVVARAVVDAVHAHGLSVEVVSRVLSRHL